MLNKNSEILFIYDAKATNPNGDIDNENRPRMDYDTETNLVSDIRLKRYIRDYAQLCSKDIYVNKKADNAKTRFKKLAKKDSERIKKVFDFIDVRLFGIVITDTKAQSFTGPVQFNWGYSLNPVSLQDSQSIVSSYGDHKGIGKDFRVNYSLIAFNGSINANVAKEFKYKDEYYGLTQDDIKFLDDAILNSIQACRTRSKIGQTPRLYIRVEGKNNRLFLNDLREFINYKSDVRSDNLRSIKDLQLTIEPLINYLKSQSNKIETIYFWKDHNLAIDSSELTLLKETFNVVLL